MKEPELRLDGQLGHDVVLIKERFQLKSQPLHGSTLSGVTRDLGFFITQVTPDVYAAFRQWISTPPGIWSTGLSQGSVE